MSKAKIVIFCVFAIWLLAGCAPGDQIVGNGASSIHIWHDDNRNVTCWIYSDSVVKAGGISCLPDNEVKR